MTENHGLFLSVFICLLGVGLCAWGVFPAINAMVSSIAASGCLDRMVPVWRFRTQVEDVSTSVCVCVCVSQIHLHPFPDDEFRWTVMGLCALSIG